MVAVNSGMADSGKWTVRKRSIQEELRTAFGEDLAEIDVVVLMTEGDNRGQTMRTWYGDISFSDK
jgi:hypothetical protein